MKQLWDARRRVPEQCSIYVLRSDFTVAYAHGRRFDRLPPEIERLVHECTLQWISGPAPAEARCITASGVALRVVPLMGPAGLDIGVVVHECRRRAGEAF